MALLTYKPSERIDVHIEKKLEVPKEIFPSTTYEAGLWEAARKCSGLSHL